MAEVVVPEDVRVQAVAHGAVCYTAPTGASYLVVHDAGKTRVFVNRCPHRRLPLDRGGRVFFTADQQWLVCTNHGAKFQLDTGECIAGPCVGKHLQLIAELADG